MIPSYQEELRIRKNKNRIFWMTVAIMTVFLHLFFQGYYPNYERFLEKEDISAKQAFLKPFGIIDIRVFPSPDGIHINDEPYNNKSKTIFDLGRYTVSIWKEGYLPVAFPIDITKENPFYTNAVNLLALPQYSRIPVRFSDIFLFNDLLLLRTLGTEAFLLTDTDFRVLQYIQTTFTPVGGSYFTDGENIMSYSMDTKKFSAVLDSETETPVRCKNISYYAKKLFCHDTMTFVGPKTSDIRENILAINEEVLVTTNHIYNQDALNTGWKYFEYSTGSVRLPESVVRINKIPYFFEKGNLLPVDEKTTLNFPKKSDWGMETISQARELDGETILLGEGSGMGKFRIIDREKQYAGTFDFRDTATVQVHKLGDVYVFLTPNAAYVYHKGSKEIVKILENVDILRMVDAKILFNKDGESYMVDLFRNPAK